MLNCKKLMSLYVVALVLFLIVLVACSPYIMAYSDDILYKGNKIANIQNMYINNEIDFDEARKELAIYLEEPDIWSDYIGSWRLITNTEDSSEFCWLCFSDNNLLVAVIGEYNSELEKFKITDKYFFKGYNDYIENMLIEDALIGGGV